MYGTSFCVLSFQPRLGLHVGFVCTQCLGKSILIDCSTAQTKSPPILNLYLIAKWYSTQHDIPVTKFFISILIFQEFVCLLYKSHLEEIKSLQQQDILHILFSKALHCSTVKVIGIFNSQLEHTLYLVHQETGYQGSVHNIIWCNFNELPAIFVYFL